MRKALGLATALALAVGVVILGAQAGEQEGAVKIGEKLPDFTMTDYNGKEHTLSKYEGKIVVIDMASHNCPVSRGADPEIQKMVDKYKEQGVVFIGIDSDKANNLADIKKYMDDNGFNWPVVKDENNVYADKVKAKVTPEMFILDKEGKLVYHGAFAPQGSTDFAGREIYVAGVLEKLIAGEAIETAERPAWGCSIKRVS